MRNIILHDLVIPLLLALTFVCKADIYNMTWEVKKKVFHYGEDLSLSCCVHNCCQEAAGWGKWTNNELTTIFIDVKYLHVDNNSKYDGGINETEFLLVIRNITEFDLNINYSCTYGFKIGHKKMLLETDVFFEETTSDPIVTRKEGIPAYLIVVACVAMPRGKGKRVLPNRAARRQDNPVQLPVNRRRRARRAEIIGQNEANPQLPIMPPQQPLLPPQQPLLPPQQPILPPQQPILPPQQPLMPPQQPLMPQYLPQQPILPPQQIGASNIPRQPAEQQVPCQGGVQLGQPAARNTVENGFRSKSDVSSYRTCRQSLEQDDVSNEETETTN